MKLQFDANQDYQLEAVKAVVDVFEGQPFQEADLFTSVDNNSKQQIIENMVVGNQLLLDEEQIAQNVLVIQERNEIEKSAVRAKVPGIIGSGIISVPTQILSEGMNFTIEMETGTGKTYVYLRTIHELYKTYGFKKFIIVVPSLAIKEGVLKNLEITKGHFAMLYSNPKVDWHVWDPRKRGQARNFATNDSLQILVITIDSLAGSGRIINQQSDYGTPIEFIKTTNPVVILDEPQNMETEVRRKAIESLNPICTLRYSATHKNIYNLLYKLDPVKAYDLGLVKKIEVDSVLSEDAYNSAYINVIKIARKGKSDLQAAIEIDKEDSLGLQRQIIKLSSGDDLFAITNREVYRDYILDRINIEEQYIEFSNGKVFYVGQKDDGLHEEIIKYQIQRTIENHFEKEAKLKERGIKVLSLFFIDRVANYRQLAEKGATKGKFALWFEESYKEIQSKPRFVGILDYSAEEVHNGYFSQDRSGDWKDTRGNSLADDDTYELIMRDKERLLDSNTPLRFIFTHSALREGWDNPNVFQICTLNETTSEMKKRQEIGRGLRLPVNNSGERVRDDSINILTVVANESYEDFAKKLQTEIEEETGVEFGGRIKDKRKRKTLKLRKGYQLDDNFKAIWDRIKYRTRYQVEFDTEELVNRSVEILKEAVIKRPRISSMRARISMSELGLTADVRDTSGIILADTTYVVIPDMLGKIQAQTYLTRKTIFRILKDSGMIRDILINPQQVIDEAVRTINTVLRELMVDGIKYEKIDNQVWEMRRFEDEELEAYLDNLVKVKNAEKTLYNYIPVDSETIERPFAEELDSREDIKFYFKLPAWFTIDTPLGNYNPDWAVVFEGDQRIYFVAETKGTNNLQDGSLSESEIQKILCGQRHFEIFQDVTYKTVRTVQDLLS